MSGEARIIELDVQTTFDPTDTQLETDHATRGSEQNSIHKLMGMMEYNSAITGLTGGGSTNLDGLDTDDDQRPVGSLAMIVVSNELKVYQLQAGTDAESSPTIIRPDDYAASTNEKIWRRVLDGS